MPTPTRAAAAPSPCVLFDVHDLHAKAEPEPAPLLDPVLVAGGLTVIRGEIGLGKSWLALSIAHAAACGQALLDWQAARPARVFYVDGGLRFSALAERSRIVAAGIGACPRGQLTILSAAKTPLPDLGTEEGIREMDGKLLPESLDLLVLDGIVGPLATGRGATRRMQAFAAWVERLRRRGICVLLVDGPRRAATTILDERADIVLTARRPVDWLPDDGARMQMRFAVARGLAGPAVRRFEARLSTAGGRAVWTRIEAIDEEALLAWRLHCNGFSVREVARRMGNASTTTWRLIKRARALPPHLRGDPPEDEPAGAEDATVLPSETVEQPAQGARSAAAPARVSASVAATALAAGPPKATARAASTT